VRDAAFQTATAISPRSPGVFGAHCGSDWFTPRGPHGGFLAAIVVRAMTDVVDEPARAPRSITLHYLRPPLQGDIEIAVTVQRAGRSLTTLTANLTQGGKLCVIAIAAFSLGFEPLVDYAPNPPVVPPPDEFEPTPVHPDQAAMARQFAIQPLDVRPRDGSRDIVVGGWMALREPPPVDAALMALLADAYMPTPWVKAKRLVGAPTIDLTIHFRVPDPATYVARDEPVLGIFRSKESFDGFFDEEGELWSPGGVLLAQCRQLGLLVGM
jgi:acyl-CoA thioesterase